MTNQNVEQERNNWNFSPNEKWKQYWKDTELVPSTREDKQLPFLINKLKEELDINKIETVLEVGVGYGRIAKAILDTFPNISEYHGLDISENAWNQCVEYLKGYENFYAPAWQDFDDYKFPGWFDLVISVETMSCVPENISIDRWIKKMCNLSKKYVVNLDYVNTTHPIFNNGHDYKHAYLSQKWNGEPRNNKPVLFSYPFSRDETLFIFKVS